MSAWEQKSPGVFVLALPFGDRHAETRLHRTGWWRVSTYLNSVFTEIAATDQDLTAAGAQVWALVELSAYARDQGKRRADETHLLMAYALRMDGGS